MKFVIGKEKELTTILSLKDMGNGQIDLYASNGDTIDSIMSFDGGKFYRYVVSSLTAEKLGIILDNCKIQEIC